jgi:hypothetical protein
MIDWAAKESSEVREYSYDFAPDLADGETLSARTVTVDGVSKDSDSLTGSIVKVTPVGRRRRNAGKCHHAGYHQAPGIPLSKLPRWRLAVLGR